MMEFKCLSTLWMQDNCGTWWCRRTQRRSYTARTLLLHHLHHLHLLYLLHLACLACHQIDKKLCWLHSVKHSWFLPNPFPLLGMFFSAYSPQSFLSILSWMICTHQLKTQNTLPIGWISLFPSPPWNTMLILVLSTLTKSPGAYIFDVILIHPPHSWQLMFWLDRFPVVLAGRRNDSYPESLCIVAHFDKGSVALLNSLVVSLEYPSLSLFLIEYFDSKECVNRISPLLLWRLLNWF